MSWTKEAARVAVTDTHTTKRRLWGASPPDFWGHLEISQAEWEEWMTAPPGPIEAMIDRLD